MKQLNFESTRQNAILICSEKANSNIFKSVVNASMPQLTIEDCISDSSRSLRLLNQRSADFVFMWLSTDNAEWASFIDQMEPRNDCRYVIITHNIYILHKALKKGIYLHTLAPEGIRELAAFREINLSQGKAQSNTIVVNRRKNALVVSADDINMIMAEGAYSLLNTSKFSENEKCSKNLRFFQNYLKDSPYFFKISRSAIINIRNIQEISHSIDQKGFIRFKNGYTYEVSRAIKNRTIKLLQKTRHLDSVA